MSCLTRKCAVGNPCGMEDQTQNIKFEVGTLNAMPENFARKLGRASNGTLGQDKTPRYTSHVRTFFYENNLLQAQSFAPLKYFLNCFASLS